MSAERCPIHWSDPAREAAFHAWLQPLCAAYGLDPASLVPASADASFRRYFRLHGPARSLIVMDAPPPQEDVRPFIEVAERLHAAGLHAPRVLARDVPLGFLLLDDLGREPYLQALQAGTPARADALMRDAIAALVQWQAQGRAEGLPPYDEPLLRRELELFPQWCVAREYGQAWDTRQQARWEQVSMALVASALAQPQVVVHRDWMPRNLMVTEPNPGVLDFQDAVRGPITYDIASLLRDAFVSWDEEREIDWAARWWQQTRERGLFGEHPMGADFGECWRALEWMGLQRHLKVLGIFCRLKHRDGKPHYSADLPRFFGYVARVAVRYRELKPLIALIEPMSGPIVSTGYTLR